MSGEKFKRKDIIMLQDPQDLSNREIENFAHLRRAKEQDQVRYGDTRASISISQ